ncbi:hypothetical protein HS088_TW09G00174 [Tripterygium wilfordii]|uniref:RIN4 pathogenic type III effector avirulence factor Avr cleavage site domain-containing protein n=1 Tax=Tripterygium wilfordii TaxID=458696 RepID=A0A7J7D726_TRIWF|nr:RPM1-interacting protein 4-like [Tripterygium wilfordii]KAF5742132.1 hypothetical protein HS088_TW09G00174 [Tripterygium wilfordii]
MAQHHHVPKFGNWDKDNVPYTAYFENARKEKGSRMMNPNDPEENPEAFSLGTPSSVLSFGSHESNQAGKQKMEGKALSSESVSTDKSSSDQSLMHPSHRRSRIDRKKTLVEGSHSLSSSVSANSRNTSSASHQSSSTRQRTASVPKFGSWDEADPRSGDGFTLIFAKVKEEKHKASQVPIVPPRPNNRFDNQRMEGSSSSKSKFCCCFFPRGR